MKKVLSIMLVLCMLASLLPSVAIASEANENVKIVYDFANANGNGFADSVEQNAIVYRENDATNQVDTYEKSNGFWKFHATEKTSQTFYTAVKKGFMILYCWVNASWGAIKLKVPTAGDYTISLQTIGGPSNGEVYLLPSSIETKTDIAAALTEENLLGAVDFSSGKLVTFPKKKQLNAGEYIIVIKAVVPSAIEVRFSTLTLTSGTGKEKVPMGTDAKADKTSIDVDTEGDFARITTTKVYMSDATAADASGITYEAVGDAVSVDSTGKVTANRAGRATVNVKLGDAVLGSIDFTAISSKYNTNTKIVYDFANANDNGYADGVNQNDLVYRENDATNQVDTYDKSNGFWKFHATEKNSQTFYTQVKKNSLLLYCWGTDATWGAIKLKVPTAGDYTISLKTKGGPSNGEVYLLPSSIETKADIAAALTEENLLGAVDFSSGNLVTFPKKKQLDAGEYIIVIKSSAATSFSTLTLTSGTGADAVPMGLIASISDSNLEPNETATITAVEYLSDTTKSSVVPLYSSSNDAVAEVSENGVVTAKKKGSAVITVSSDSGSKKFPVNVSDTSAPSAGTVKFCATASGDIAITTSIEDYVQGQVGNIARGTSVTVTAPKVSGKVFRGWLRGGADGMPVSFDPEYTFDAMTNISLFAKYTEESATEYYNWNGEFLGDNYSGTPTMLGYVFDKWKDVTVNEVARKIAVYAKADTTYTVKTPEGEGQYQYDDAVTLNSETPVYWYRDAKLAAYGQSYTFYVWDDTEITTSEAGESGPRIILDTAKGNNYMVEYDAGDKEIVEVGMIFGTSASITIDNCSAKAASQRRLTHGQFMAENDAYAAVRGYLIYNDSGTYRVIYAD